MSSLSILRVYNKRVVALLIVFAAVTYALEAFKQSIGLRVYFVGLVTIVLVVGALVWREAVKQFPEGTGFTSEKSISLQASFKQACEVVPRAIENCDWKLTQRDAEHGHFKAKIGRSFNTWYGQLFKVEVTSIDTRTSDIHIRCEACHAIMDHGRNEAMIEKFMSELQGILKA